MPSLRSATWCERRKKKKSLASTDLDSSFHEVFTTVTFIEQENVTAFNKQGARAL